MRKIAAGIFHHLNELNAIVLHHRTINLDHLSRINSQNFFC